MLSQIGNDMQSSHDLPDEIRAFDKEVDDLLKSYEQQLREKVLPSFDVVFHYTTAEGLKGILDSGRLWLTDISSLNDPSELAHGYSIFVKCLKENAHTPNEQAVAARFEHVRSDGIVRMAANFFVFSLSRHENDLGQWLAYADDGRGFALGFDRHVLDDVFCSSSLVRQEQQENQCFPITYCDEGFERLSRNILKLASPMMSLEECYLGDASVSLAQAALRTALLFKHSAYTREVEYRYLQVLPNSPVGVKLRIRGSELVRYMEFDWRKVAPRALKKILIGPAANTNELAVRDCLRQSLPDIAEQVQIIRSKIPYRPS
jgi:Protein of unknown function (DUF2971)